MTIHIKQSKKKLGQQGKWDIFTWTTPKEEENFKCNWEKYSGNNNTDVMI